MKFKDFRTQYQAEAIDEAVASDPVMIRKLLRGAKVSINDKQVPVNIARVMKGMEIFNRTGKTQSIPKQVLPHYQAYLSKQQAVAGAFANRAGSVKEEVEHINEAEGETPANVIQKSVDPPPVIMLKRSGVRIFPDGRRVAVYTNSKLDLVFSVPYDAYHEYKPGAAFGGGTIPGVQVK